MRGRFKRRSHQTTTRYLVHPTQVNRIKQLQESVPGLFLPPKRTVLYIGASKRAHCLQELYDAEHEITLLEVWPDNAARYFRDDRVAHVKIGSVQDVDPADTFAFHALGLPYLHYDVVFWWHGPEHIECDELGTTLGKLETMAPMVILACPWGKYIQNKTGGNPFEEHRCHLYPETFKARGYETATLGRKDVKGSNLLAWRVE